MQDIIEEAGGMLRVGLYTADFDVSNQRGGRAAIQENFAKYEWLHDVFPFNPPVFEMIDRLREDLEACGHEPVYLTEDAVVRKPKLHQKTQLFLSNEVVSTLVPLPGWRGLILE